MSASVEMVQLGHLDDLCPKDLWDRSLALDREATERIFRSGEFGPAHNCCPICSSPNLREFVVKHHWRIDECTSCGFRFTNPPPTSTQVREFYNSEAKLIENMVFESSRAVRLPIFERRVGLIQEYVKTGALLDVGGSVGILVDALAKAHAAFKVSLVDLNEDSIERVRARYPGVDAHNVDIFDHRGSYDVITLWDTIEHLREVNRSAAHLFELLNPGGYLFVSTPNIDSFEHWVGQERHPQVEPLSHLNYFSPTTLRMLLKHNGFDIIDYVTPNGSFDIAYVNRMLEEGSANFGQLGGFLQHKLQDAAFADGFASLISRHGLAGNMVMIAKRHS
jgi:2-polyprenyl-3-methyl-5-hydroxy-6-metoxy-1,4-benzoquinol methylase